MSSASSVLKGIGGLSKLGGLGQKSNNYNFFAVLHSRTTMEAVIKKFDLISVYDVSEHSLEKTIKELEDNVAFEEQNDDNITIEVYDKDPKRAADIANYFIEVLNEVSIKLGTQEARENREFIENRLTDVKRNLGATEDALSAFQKKSGMIITPEQTSSVNAIAPLYVMKEKLELEVAVAEKNMSTNSPALEQMKLELSELNKKVSGIPETGIQSLRLYRDAAIQEKILEFLVPIYEQAKIDEQKDVPVILVLDRAVPAEHKTKPHRLLIVFLSGTLSFFLFVLLTFILHGLSLHPGELQSLERKLYYYARQIATLYKVQVV